MELIFRILSIIYKHIYIYIWYRDIRDLSDICTSGILNITMCEILSDHSFISASQVFVKESLESHITPFLVI